MEGSMRVKLIMVMAVACLVYIHINIVFADLGTATFHKPPYVPSSCHGYKNDGVLIAAASDDIWNNKQACSKFYQVKCIVLQQNLKAENPCKDVMVVVQIVDHCGPECRRTINLSQEALSMIADPTAGVIDIQHFEYTE